MLDWMKLIKTKISVTEEVNESIMSIKNTIIHALKEENQKPQNKFKKLEEQLLDTDEKCNHLDQYSRKNGVQGIPVNLNDDELEGKIIDIFSCIGIEVKGSDVEDCHRFGYVNPKNTIIRFVNHKFFTTLLIKK